MRLKGSLDVSRHICGNGNMAESGIRPMENFSQNSCGVKDAQPLVWSLSTIS